MTWLKGKRGGLVVFALIAGLVGGGLAWVTAAALRLEGEQLEARAQAELNQKVRVAMWRLDSRLFPILAREASRPYGHYSATFTPPLAWQRKGDQWLPAKVAEPSPLLSEALPEWIKLHFQVSTKTGWESPQVLGAKTAAVLENSDAALDNVTPEREQLLARLRRLLPPETFLAQLSEQDRQLWAGSPVGFENTVVLGNEGAGNTLNITPMQQQSAQPTQVPGLVNPFPSQQPGRGQVGQSFDNEVQNRANQRVQLETQAKSYQQDENLEKNSKKRDAAVTVRIGPLTPLWLRPDGNDEILVLARLVESEGRRLSQGLVLDWKGVERELANEVSNLFPSASIVPARSEAQPERVMTALPLELIPGEAPVEAESPGWTPLRIGLALAWLAAVVALVSAGMGGWTLLELSERRMRFVSAVTHELRTPLTTLRLYLDMLTGGLVRDEQTKTEYLHTLNTESDRLNRLVGNVLDFSRLESQRPRLEITKISVGELLEQVRAAWQDRCRETGKELVVENGVDGQFTTDARLVQQILGNLIDNACKYSREAKDARLWLRAGQENGCVHLEVEDRGPGVAVGERRSIFRPFRRGRSADVTAGGVGLGLALAQRWSRLLGGRLTLRPVNAETGARFCLELPVRSSDRHQGS